MENWENLWKIGKIYGKSMENLWKNWENLWNLYGIFWKIYGTFGKIYGTLMENLGKSREQSWRNHGKTIFGSKELPKNKKRGNRRV